MKSSGTQKENSRSVRKRRWGKEGERKGGRKGGRGEGREERRERERQRGKV